MPKGVPKNFKSSILMRRIERLQKAAVEDSWKGSKPPEDHAKIERELYNARLALINYVIEHCI
ncbi:hypothetical protein PP744_gp030 [Rhizobium phage RHph_N38]|uniref:Uncharacterized protein n=1 Tax=Rhizobium phage RHph_N38 TaxID=2509750 RepID=A0A7S5UWT0_9CAUD|nr:hypothetical protein PP744_gp030 [Rhizobium phage RHph_N38]QIG70493.1 hypothetical protein EVB89_030 [Rhizobium phage RHph_N38]